jgi:alkylated DNA repair dioxygenase AlkB
MTEQRALNDQVNANIEQIQGVGPNRFVLEPGLVLIRNFVSDEECQRLADTALRMGEERESRFYTSTGEGSKVLITGENGRGRIYDAATRFGTNVTDLCPQAVEMIKAVDPTMPEMTCTHVLINLYTNSDGLVWHRDIYENDGASDRPVVNLCVGASCRFGYKHQDEDPDQAVILQSGDCLIFGGRCRLIKHAVLDVMLDDCVRSG